MGTLAIDLAGNFDVGIAVWAGIVGAAAMLVVIYGGLAMGMTRMDLLRTLGTMIAPHASTSTIFAVGALVHAMMGAAFGLAHAGIITGLDPSTSGAATGLGLLIGLVHGLAVTLVLPTMLTMAHPLVRHGDVARPGAMLTGFGTMTPMGVVAAHGMFGLVAAAIYAGAAG
jgi:hypothetical protein